ncbi:MAG: ester cyclase [Bacteroidota bacterium]
MSTLTIPSNTLTKSNWSEQEVKNVALITDFVQNLMNDHDFTYVRNTYGHSDYVQHNRSIPDRMEGILTYMEGFAKKFPEFSYDVKHIYADGDFVTFHSHATIKKAHLGNPDKGLNIVDIWRVVDGQIVEHWDALQPIDGSMKLFALLAGGKKANNNGLF